MRSRQVRSIKLSTGSQRRRCFPNCQANQGIHEMKNGRAPPCPTAMTLCRECQQQLEIAGAVPAPGAGRPAVAKQLVTEAFAASGSKSAGTLAQFADKSAPFVATCKLRAVG